jgi:hypothetical protein
LRRKARNIALLACWTSPRTVSCLAGAFSSDQRVFLDPLARRCRGALVGVPLVAANLVYGAPAQPDDVEGIEAGLGLRAVLAEGLLVAAAHVDRHRADRGLALAGEKPMDVDP